jgi:release factor glutamine methyltransferase
MHTRVTLKISPSPTISKILNTYKNIEIELLLSHVLKTTKKFLFMHGEKELTRNQEAKLTRMINRRLMGEPVAYILGYKDFLGYRFKVNKHVLIPRPETEELVYKVHQVYKVLKEKQESINILDIGTGSGCIAIAVAKVIFAQRKDDLCRIVATDISPQALTVAKANARAHKVKIKFIHSDLFGNIPGKFDIIVANLPYVPAKLVKKAMLHPQVPVSRWAPKNVKDDPYIGLKYEPVFALTDGTNSWQIYKRFFEQVRGHVQKGSVIFLEIDPAQKRDMPDIIKKYLPNANILFHKDFHGRHRFCEITLR